MWSNVNIYVVSAYSPLTILILELCVGSMPLYIHIRKFFEPLKLELTLHLSILP